MISTITNRGTLRFMVFKDNFTASKFIEFMKKLIRSSGRKVFLIVDRHPVHRSAATKEFICEHEDQISLFFLPAYSPELNPDELLNNDLKNNAVGRRRAASQRELFSNVRRHLSSRQKTPHVVANFFKGRHVNYAAD